MTEHSKGPWRLEKHDDGGLMIRAADGTLLARVFRGILGAEVAEANARLMVAAPALLGACTQVLIAITTEGEISNQTLQDLENTLVQAAGEEVSSWSG